MKRPDEITNDMLIKRNKELRQEYTSPVIKWYSASMTKEERYKFGMMTCEEYAQWQEELALEDAAKSAIEDNAVNHTFWENDEGDRGNISQDSYAEFLAENSINVSNKNVVDVDALLNQTNL